MSLDIYSKEQKDKIVCQIELMKSEYEDNIKDKFENILLLKKASIF